MCLGRVFPMKVVYSLEDLLSLLGARPRPDSRLSRDVYQVANDSGFPLTFGRGCLVGGECGALQVRRRCAVAFLQGLPLGLRADGSGGGFGALSLL